VCFMLLRRCRSGGLILPNKASENNSKLVVRGYPLYRNISEAEAKSQVIITNFFSGDSRTKLEDESPENGDST
jgi:hypothetical protein